MFKALPQEYRDLPWSVRKAKGLLKPDESAPMYESLSVAATEDAPKSEDLAVVEASAEESVGATSGVGIAADPKLLKEINEKLSKLEKAVGEQYYEENFIEEDTYEYAGSGIREQAGASSVMMTVLYFIISAWALHFLLTSVMN